MYRWVAWRALADSAAAQARASSIWCWLSLSLCGCSLAHSEACQALTSPHPRLPAVALSTSRAWQLVGVVFASLQGGLGEASCLAMTSHYR